MPDQPQQGLPARILAGLILLVSWLFAGMALGLLYVKVLVPSTGMGFDALADALSGMMLGGVCGLIAALLMIWRFNVRRQWTGSGVALAVAVLTFGGLALTAPEQQPEPSPSQPIVQKSFQPTFRVQVRLSHTQEILEAVAADERPLPFTEAEVSSGKPELILVGWGPDFATCTATPADADLEMLLPPIQDVMASQGPYCRTDNEALKLGANWNLAGQIGDQGLDAGCLATEHKAIRTLAETIDVIGKRLCR